ncbi:hypothetical protein DWUX_1353 [Desulfovibrio diazotrophicus]|nr:hypothetical protein DWUX_1353 [Desulfovibrio diazotrophicus]
MRTRWVSATAWGSRRSQFLYEIYSKFIPQGDADGKIFEIGPGSAAGSRAQATPQGMVATPQDT